MRGTTASVRAVFVPASPLSATLLILLPLIAVVPLAVQEADGQGMTVADPAAQRSVEVYMEDDGQVHVRHIVQKASSPRQLDLIGGEISNVRVAVADGGEGEDVQHAVINGGDGIMIFPSGTDTIVEYDLAGALVQKDGVWTWDFLYLESTKFFFPDNIDMIFVTGKPVMLDEKKAINCHGCQMILEFFEDGDVEVEAAVWEQRRFSIPFITLAEIDPFGFDQPSRSISFGVSGENRIVTAVMPLELLWEPYEAYLNEEKIMVHSYIRNDTHVWLSFRPQSDGIVTIVGTTVVPEFSLAVAVLLLAVASVLAAQALLPRIGGGVMFSHR